PEHPAGPVPPVLAPLSANRRPPSPGVGPGPGGEGRGPSGGASAGDGGASPHHRPLRLPGGQPSVRCPDPTRPGGGRGLATGDPRPGSPGRGPALVRKPGIPGSSRLRDGCPPAVAPDVGGGRRERVFLPASLSGLQAGRLTLPLLPGD